MVLGASAPPSLGCRVHNTVRGVHRRCTIKARNLPGNAGAARKSRQPSEPAAKGVSEDVSELSDIVDTRTATAILPAMRGECYAIYPRKIMVVLPNSRGGISD